MLNPFEGNIDRVGFISAHSGSYPDSGHFIYEVAGIILEKSGRKKNHSFPVKYSKFTGRDKFYSGLLKKDLKKAPARHEVIQKMNSFFNGVDVIFAFDYQDNLKEMRDYCEGARVIDLGFATEFFLPHLMAHTPKRLWECVHNKSRKMISFSAREIADLSVAVMGHICANLLSDNKNTGARSLRYFLNKSDTLFGSAFLHLSKNSGAYFGEPCNSSSATDSGNWKAFLEKALSPKKNEADGTGFKRISTESLTGLYKGLCKSEKGYRYREEQVEYARHVAEALNSSSVLTIEAGTGTGKTQGYLVPVLEFLRLNPEARVVISTYTKSLQEQIFNKEMRFTREIFECYSDIPVALLKGKSSYICAEKLDQLYDEGLSGDKLLAWLYFLNVIFHFDETDSDSVGEKVKKYLNRHYYLERLLGEISAKSGCPPKHTKCPAQVVTARAQRARLVITNHHKLALLDHDPILTDLFKNYVIDEANHFENAVRSALAESAGSREITVILTYLESASQRVLVRAAGDTITFLENALNGIRDTRADMSDLGAVLFTMGPKASVGEVRTLNHAYSGFRDGDIRTHIKDIRNDLIYIQESLSFLKDKDLCRALKINIRTVMRMKNALKQLGDFSESFQTITNSVDSPNQVVSYQVFKKNWALIAQEVDVAELIQNAFFERKEGIIFTAATLCNRGRFDSFKSITGMNGEQKSNRDEPNPKPKEFFFKKIPSPFSKDAMELIIPRDAESGKYDNKESWLKYVGEALPGLIKENRGRTLVLFASYNDLENVAQKVEEAINDTTHPLLVQRKGASTINLMDEFRDIKESVLFGVDTFWYGVDFKGETLTQVIITRIPFPSPSEPIQMARKTLLPVKDYWKRYYYDTDIKMKQGIGRLIRSHTDSGKVVILDSRFNRKSLI